MIREQVVNDTVQAFTKAFGVIVRTPVRTKFIYPVAMRTYNSCVISQIYSPDGNICTQAGSDITGYLTDDNGQSCDAVSKAIIRWDSSDSLYGAFSNKYTGYPELTNEERLEVLNRLEIILEDWKVDETPVQVIQEVREPIEA